MHRFTPRPAPLALALSLVFASGALWAQAGSPLAPDAAPIAIHLPAQPLGEALNAWARQTGAQLAVQQSLVTGRTAPAVTGPLTARQALDRLLAGSGLTATVEGATVVVRQATSSIGGEAVLPTVTVTANAIQGTAATGYRIKRSSVAGFTDQEILDTPFSVRVLPAELLANQLVKDLDDLGRLDASVTAAYRMPGFHARTEIRGFDVDDGQNYRYNGLPYLRQQQTALENKEQIEILKGLSALQAGFASPGGIVNYVTKRPTADPVNDLHVSLDQHGDTSIHSDISRRSADGRFGVRVNAAAEALRSYVDEARGDRQFISVATDWAMAPDTLLKLDLEHQRRDQVIQLSLWPDVNGKLPRDIDPTTFRGQTWAAYKTEATTANARVEQALGGRWTAILEGNWNATRHPFNEVGFYNIQPNGDANVDHYRAPDAQRKAATVRSMVTGAFETGGIGHELSFGLTAHRMHALFGGSFYGDIGASNIHHPVRLNDPAPSVAGSRAGFRVEESGAFVQDVLSLGKAWRFHLGGRYADREQRFLNATGAQWRPAYSKQVFTPNLAAIFKPSDQVSTYLSYVEGLENGGQAPQTGVTNPGEVMPPLVSRQWETGVKVEFTQRLAGEFALFHINRPAEFVNSSQTYVQDGSQVHKGIELSLTGKLSGQWTLHGSALVLDAQLRETGDPATQGKRPTSVPRHRLALTAEYAPPALKSWVFSGSWSHTGNRPLNSANTGEFAPAYDVFGAGARLYSQWGGTPVTWRFSVDNLFDKRYFDTSNWGQLIPGAPRTLKVGAEFQF